MQDFFPFTEVVLGRKSINILSQESECVWGFFCEWVSDGILVLEGVARVFGEWVDGFIFAGCHGSEDVIIEDAVCGMGDSVEREGSWVCL